MEYAKASNGQVSPSEIRAKWTNEDFSDVIALIEIENAEFEVTVDLGKEIKVAAADKANRAVRAGKVKALRERMLKKLNTQTFADLAAMEGKTEKEALVERQVELAKKHNANINPAMLPPVRK